jgi:protein TonB
MVAAVVRLFLGVILLLGSTIESKAFCLSLPSNAEVNILTNPDSTIHNLVEVEPNYNGGDAAMQEFIKSNIKYPSEAIKKKYEGKVYVKFIVERDGSVTHVSIARGVNSVLDDEAVRVIELMPKWNPGYQKGKAVRTNVVVPIVFKLGKTSKKNKKR